MTDQKRILIIEDEAPMRRFVGACLDPEHYELLEASTGKEGIRMTANNQPHAILLDLGLPDMDGVELTKGIREWSRVPIVVISAREEVQDKVAALDAGADDYLSKPFSVDEFLARIRAALRRSTEAANEEPTIFEAFGVHINFTTGMVFRNGQRISVTQLERRILAALARRPGQVVTHRDLLSEVWGPAHAANYHYVRVYMRQLRHKLEEDPGQPKLIVSEYGIGYRMNIE